MLEAEEGTTGKEEGMERERGKQRQGKEDLRKTRKGGFDSE